MKKNLIIGTIVLILLAIGLVVGLFLVQQQQELRKKAAPASTLSILPPVKTVNVGDEFSLTLQLNTATNVVTGAELHISFDAGKLTLKDLLPSTTLPNVFVSPKIEAAAGNGSMTLAAQPGNEFQGNDTIATLKFAAKAPGQATVSIDPKTVVTGYKESNNVLVSQSSSTITVLAAAVNPTPTPAVGASPTPIPTSVPGQPTSAPTATPTTSGGTGSGGISGGTGGIQSTPTPTKKATPTPTKSAGSSSSSAAPVAGVSAPLIAALGSGFLLLVVGIILAL